MKIRVYLIPLLFLASPVEALDDSSSKAARLGQYKDWVAFESKDGEKTCFALSEGADVSGSQQWARIYISNHPAIDIQNEIGIHFSYDLEPGSKSKVTIGSNEFSLFTKGRGAFIESSDVEKRLVDDMKGNDTMMVESHASSGETINHRFSLRGMREVVTLIDGVCVK